MPYTHNNLLLFSSNNLNIRYHPNKFTFESAFRDLYELIHTDEYHAIKNDIKYNSNNLYAEVSISILNLNNTFPKLKEFIKEKFDLDIDELMEYEEFKNIDILTFDFPEFKDLETYIINEENISRIDLLEKFENNSSNLFTELVKLGKISADELHDIHKRLISEGKNFEF